MSLSGKFSNFRHCFCFDYFLSLAISHFMSTTTKVNISLEPKYFTDWLHYKNAQIYWDIAGILISIFVFYSCCCCCFFFFQTFFFVHFTICLSQSISLHCMPYGARVCMFVSAQCDKLCVTLYAIKFVFSLFVLLFYILFMALTHMVDRRWHFHSVFEQFTCCLCWKKKKHKHREGKGERDSVYGIEMHTI